MLTVTFHGTRGSFPQNGPEFSIFGGSTSCVSLHTSKHLYVIDAGTGFGKLSPLIKQQKYTDIHLFLSHLHMDHIAGLPSLSQAWDPSHRLHLYTPDEVTNPFGGTPTILNNHFSPPYFPVPWSQFPIQQAYHPFSMGESINPTPECQVQTIPLNHPGEACGYAFHINDRKIVYLSDTNHTNGSFDEFIPFTQDADLLIYDATFNTPEHNLHPHFGHSTWEAACELASLTHTKTLALYHHNYGTTDATLLEREKQAQHHFPNTFAARCGQSLIF